MVSKALGLIARADTIPVVHSGSSIHPSRPWCTEHLWDEDVKAFQAEFNILAPEILDSSDPTDEMEAVFSGFLERKRSIAAEIKEVCLLSVHKSRAYFFAIAYSSTPDCASHGRRTATQIVQLYYPMSRPGVTKSWFTILVWDAISHGFFAVSRRDSPSLGM
jgi:hypothetical protein